MFINIILILASAVAAQINKQPLVTIPDGTLQGTILKSVGSNREFLAFRGVPYAQPPLGPLRFQPPIKNHPWTGTLQVTKDQAKCVQTSGILGLSIDGSEDCLYLNVYTPALNASLPVMVWIFGGGFTIGGADYQSYAPDFLVDKGVVFVSLNYRLGAFGFLSTQDLNCPGNWGLKDQVMALEWVKRNIERFGGDSERITIAGQSAGSASVSYLLQTKKTEGLYSGAIMQSGTSLCLWSLTRTAKEVAFAIGARLGIFTADSAELIKELRMVDYKRLKRAENDVYYIAIAVENVFSGMPMGPVIEPVHPGALITEKSHQLLEKGQFNHVPTIIGLNSNEAKSFLGLFIDVLKPLLTRYDLEIAKMAPHDLTRNATKRIMAGNEVRQHFFGDRLIASGPSEKIIHFISVEQFNRPIRETVNQMSKYTDVYYYEFGYKGSLGEFENDFPGVGHFEEIFYLFANKANANNDDDVARKRLLSLWTNFMKYRNPTHQPVEGFVWPPNSPTANDVIYMSFNSSLTLKTNPDQQDWLFYKKLYDKYGDEPYGTF